MKTTTCREDLALTLLHGFVHDSSSPLGALVSNVDVASSITASGSENPELREILADLKQALARLEQLFGDLRAYTGAVVATLPLEDVVGAATRLARMHLSRRVRLVVDVDVERSVAPASSLRLLRPLAEALIAMTPGPPIASERPVLTLSLRARRLTLTLTPAPPESADALVREILLDVDPTLEVLRDEARLTLTASLGG